MVCTGNTCRSPLVERWLAHLLDGRFQVTSAGLLAWSGQPAAEHARSVADDHGVTLADHRSRRVEREDVARADLVLAMTRAHAWGIGAHDVDAASRTFLLPEAVRRARSLGPRGRRPLREWALALGADRDHRRPGRASDELEDPAGQPVVVYEQLAERVAPLVAELAELLVGPATPDRRATIGDSDSWRR